MEINNRIRQLTYFSLIKMAQLIAQRYEDRYGYGKTHCMWKENIKMLVVKEILHEDRALG